jgi:hypothetical protein
MAQIIQLSAGRQQTCQRGLDGCSHAGEEDATLPQNRKMKKRISGNLRNGLEYGLLWAWNQALQGSVCHPFASKISCRRVSGERGQKEEKRAK